MRYVIAIDAGTTGVTSLLVDEDGVPTRKAYREFPSYFPQPGWVEQDPEEIWRAVTETVAEVSAEITPSNIAAVGITNQRETTVLWERSTLRPIHRAIVWQCRRSAPICEELRARGVEPEVRRRTGLLLDPYFSGTKLTWFFRNNPELASRTAKGELAFGTIDTWLIAKLTDGLVHATDPSNASRTLLYNLDEARWDPYLLELMEVPDAVLPKVESSSHLFGECTLPPLSGVPIGGVAGDQQSALFGQACFRKGMAKNTYGTGSFILTNAGAEAQISAHGLLTSVAWDIGSRIEYALEGSIFITGAGIQWLRDGLGIIGSAAEAGPLAASVTDSAGVYFVPALTGLGAPHWDPYARGLIAGITRGTTRAHIVRATIEAMAYQTCDVMDAMTADMGSAPIELRVDGGASVMDLLCQLQADLLGVPVARSAVAETTAMGAAYLGGLSTGVWESTDAVASLWRADRTFDPQMSDDQRLTMLDGWKRALARTLS